MTFRNAVDYRKVKKVDLDGRTFDSKAEAQLYVYLRELQNQGEIQNLRHQVTVALVDGDRKRKIEYKADFVCDDVKLARPVWVECKGFETDKWKMKLKLWRSFGPGLLRIYKLDWNRLVLAEEVEGGAWTCPHCHKGST